MYFLVYRTVCGTLATGSELFHLYLRHDATDKWTGLWSLKELIRDNCELFDVSPSYSARSILGYQLTLWHSFNLCYTSTNDTYLHTTDHLLLGKAYVNSMSIQALSVASATLTRNEHYKRKAQSLPLLHIRKQTTQREPDCSTRGLDSRRDQQSKWGT
jgi:hypothetical protein